MNASDNILISRHVERLVVQVAEACPWMSVECAEDAPLILVTARDEGRDQLRFEVGASATSVAIVKLVDEMLPDRQRAATVELAVQRAAALAAAVSEAGLPDGVTARAAGGCVVVENAAEGRVWSTLPEYWGPAFLENGFHEQDLDDAAAIARIGGSMVVGEEIDPYEA